MLNQEELELLSMGVEVWNRWRAENLQIRPDLRGANLNCAQLQGVNFRGVNLRGADLNWADLRGSNLRGANLSYTNLSWATLRKADFSCANLTGANLRGANLSSADLCSGDLRSCDLREVNLWCAQLSGANLEKADLSDCLIYGIAAWNLKLKGANQSNLVVTPTNEMAVTVDNLEVAQFIGLLLQNHQVRDVINTIRAKIVLILGDFYGQRQEILQGVRDLVRQQNYVPVVFDLHKPVGRDLKQKILTVANMSQMIVVDLTDCEKLSLPNMIPQLYGVPIQAITQSMNYPESLEWQSLEHLGGFKIYTYESTQQALAYLKAQIGAKSCSSLL